jgi:hypothetical protein
MNKTNTIINVFSNGEVGPKLDARTDFQKYYSSCRVLENAIPLPQGGTTKRPGTYYVATGKGKAILFGFHFSTIQAYILEFGEYYIRFYKDHGIITTTFTEWYTSTDYSLGALVTYGYQSYRCIIAHTSGTFATDLSALKWKLCSPETGVTDSAYEIPTTYTSAELFELKFIPSNDVVYITHPAHKLAKLTRFAHATWVLADVVTTFDKTWKITGSERANPAKLTVAGFDFLNGEEIIVESVGGMTQLNNRLFTVYDTDFTPPNNRFGLLNIDASGYGWYTSGGICYRNPYFGKAKIITAITKASTAVVTCYGHSFPNGTSILIRDVEGMVEVNDRIYTTANVTTDTFQLTGVNSSAYTTYTTGGIVRAKPFVATDEYPSCGTFYEQRLMLARGQTVWGSTTADYENFQQGTLDDNAIQYTLASDKVDAIQWIIAQDYCMLGSIGGVWRFWGGSADQPITPSSITAKKQTGFGVKNIDPEMVDDTILFVQRAGTRVRELGYSWEKDGYVANDMTIMSDHIAKGATSDDSGIADSDYQSEPFSIYLAVRSDGQLLGFVRDRSQQVAGWCRIVTGRTSSVSTDTVDTIVSTEAETGTTITMDIVRRETVGNETVETITSSETQSDSTVVMTITRVESTPTVDSWDEIKSVAVISNDSEEDEIWQEVKRTIGGVDKYYIEYYKPHEFYGQLKDAFYVDSGLTYDGGDAVTDIVGATKANPCVVTHTSHHEFTNGQKIRISGVEGMVEINQGLTTAYTVANKTDHTYELSGIDSRLWSTYTSGGQAQVVANSITGLTHLEGRTIDILIDGARHPSMVVMAGAVSLSWYGNLIHAGLPYSPIIQPMKLEPNPGGQSSQGKIKRIYGMTVRFYETFSAIWGSTVDTLDIIPFGTGVTPGLFTGDVRYPFGGDIDSEGNIYITQDGPFPMTVLSIVSEVETY